MSPLKLVRPTMAPEVMVDRQIVRDLQDDERGRGQSTQSGRAVGHQFTQVEGLAAGSRASALMRARLSGSAQVLFEDADRGGQQPNRCGSYGDGAARWRAANHQVMGPGPNPRDGPPHELNGSRHRVGVLPTMPELIEVEFYRRWVEATVGYTIASVDAPDPWYLKRGTTAAGLSASLTGTTLTEVRRIGKLLLLDTTATTLGLRFGMTGRVMVDGRSPLVHLEYSSTRPDPAWVRFSLEFKGGPRLDVVDPRRLGGAELAPDESRLGDDALTISPRQLRAGLARSRAGLKTWLLDQHRIAGIGNLLADEMLWRGGLDPARPAGSLSGVEVRRLHRHLRATIEDLTRRGGSHTGDLQIARVRGAGCPRDGTPLQRRTIGGRTTYSCPLHQR